MYYFYSLQASILRENYFFSIIILRFLLFLSYRSLTKNTLKLISIYIYLNTLKQAFPIDLGYNIT